MIAVLQRVAEASVRVDNEKVGQIDQGLLVLLGVAEEDDSQDVDWLLKKIVGMRIFSDAEGKMNLSLSDIKGQMLVVSQFTLHASTKKGNRPSFVKAAKPDIAVPLYEEFLRKASGMLDSKVEAGIFGADMKVGLVNDGPVTIIIDSKDKK